MAEVCDAQTPIKDFDHALTPADPTAQPLTEIAPRNRIATDFEDAVSSLRDDIFLLEGARALADVGRYQDAIACCEKLIERQPFACEPYLMLASIAQERGQLDEAKRLLKKAIYLCPTQPHPYLEIGALYRSEGDLERASKMNHTALELLQQIPPETVVGPTGGPSAGEWISHLCGRPQDGG